MSAAGAAADPVDVETMRATANLLMRYAFEPIEGAELEAHIAKLRGHIELLIPEVEKATGKRPKGDIPSYCALACVGEARLKLSARAQRPPYDIPYARKLSRVLGALLDHHETLSNQAMCLVCDREIRDAQATVPYDEISPSSGGATKAGRIHEACAKAIPRR